MTATIVSGDVTSGTVRPAQFFERLAQARHRLTERNRPEFTTNITKQWPGAVTVHVKGLAAG